MSTASNLRYFVHKTGAIYVVGECFDHGSTAPNNFNLQVENQEVVVNLDGCEPERYPLFGSLYDVAAVTNVTYEEFKELLVMASLNKKEANDIANMAVAEIGGDWANSVFNNLGWVVQIESKELNMHMNRNSSLSGVAWNVYSESDGGFVCSAPTPSEALAGAADIFSARAQAMESAIGRYHSMIKTIRG
jgi:hypothetical protein